ncbi:helix-turn-helix domain-containing protein [Paenibacillus sp. MBLB4367]|uniref:response regulator transcription factor n=1 Tax=Paenibacillus sp. MBLB4367 TaxID=3384767 RepID=UPI00390811E7
MRLLIVDDEVIIRTGLSTVINWKELGLELLPAAASAEEALRRIPDEQPHIMMTDIRMTGMDGLELAAEAKKLFPDMEIIILTGYDDFKYAQQAIREGVSDYLLKMSRPEEIIKAALKAKQRLQEKWQAKKQGSIQQAVFRKRMLERLVIEGVDDPGLAAQLPSAGMDKVSAGMRTVYKIILVSATGWRQSSGGENLLLFAVDNIVSELLACETLMERERLAVIVREDEGTGMNLPSLIVRIEATLKCVLFVAVGSAVGDYRELHRSYKEADYAHAFHVLPEASGIFDYRELKGRKGGRTVCSKEEESELSAILMRDHQAELRLWVNQTVGRQLAEPQVTPQSLRAFLQSVVIAAHRWLERAAAASGRTAPSAETSFETEGKPEEALFKQLHAVMTAYHKEIGEDRTSYIPRAIAYMQDNLDKSITLQQVAKQVHLNPNHFSEVFKRETGLNYLEYLTRERMNRACELLATTTAKVSDIAGLVGYEDIKYFSQLFKKQTGQTPSEYRQMKMNTL